uniref:MARVEL domain-containing protein n=1 Tax=Plectus sambesii TaxID=2011161 RepID=A0A914UT33_9BILA
MELQREPLIWMKIAQVCIAFLTLILMISYEACGYVNYTCLNSTATSAGPYKNQVCISYPFRLSQQRIVNYCDGPKDAPQQHIMHVNYDGPSKFFVTITVMSMMLAAATVGFYLKFWDKYHFTTTFAFPDLIATFTFAAYWLAATFSWGAALGGLKDYTSPEQVVDEIKLISVCHPPIGKCEISSRGWNRYGALDMTILLGVVSIILWYVNAGMVFNKIQAIKAEYEQGFDASAHLQYPSISQTNNGRQREPRSYGSQQPMF